MAKGSGLGMGLYIAGLDISGDVGSFSNIHGGNSPLPFTGIDKFAMERQGGKRDGGIDYSAFCNTSPNRIHSILSTLPTADQQMLGRIGSTIGSPAFAMVGKQLSYNPKRGADGSLLFDVNALANGFGLEWGDLLTAGVRTDTAATIGPGFDTGAGIAFGYQMYVHILAFTGTSVTIKVQESDDNGGSDPFADSGATATFSSAPGTARSTGTTGGIGEFIRIVTTGTFSNAQFVVMVATDRTTVVF